MCRLPLVLSSYYLFGGSIPFSGFGLGNRIKWALLNPCPSFQQVLPIAAQLNEGGIRSGPAKWFLDFLNR